MIFSKLQTIQETIEKVTGNLKQSDSVMCTPCVHGDYSTIINNPC